MSQGFSSAKELMFSVAATRLAGKDDTEEKMATSILASISSDTAATISTAASATSVSMVTTLTQLQDLGVDESSDFFKKIQAVNASILESFSNIAMANAALVK